MKRSVETGVGKGLPTYELVLSSRSGILSRHLCVRKRSPLHLEPKETRSKRLLERAQVQFVRPGASVLIVQLPVDAELGPNRAAPLESGWKAIRKQVLDRAEREYLEQALKRFQGDVNQVAEWMELTPRAVYLKLSELDIDPSLFRPQRSKTAKDR